MQHETIKEVAGKRATVISYEDGTHSIAVGPFHDAQKARGAADRAAGRHELNLFGRVIGFAVIAAAAVASWALAIGLAGWAVRHVIG